MNSAAVLQPDGVPCGRHWCNSPGPPATTAGKPAGHRFFWAALVATTDLERMDVRVSRIIYVYIQFHTCMYACIACVCINS